MLRNINRLTAEDYDDGGTIKATPKPVTAGSDLTINLDGFTPNTTVKLELDNGQGTTAPVNVEIQADGPAPRPGRFRAAAGT